MASFERNMTGEMPFEGSSLFIPRESLKSKVEVLAMSVCST